MTTLLNQLNTAITKRRAYNRTVREIQNMPLSTAWDLDIYRGDAKRLAAKAVYKA